MPCLKSLALFALTAGFASLTSAQANSGTGSTTRYWDCCKGSCAWPGKADVSNPVKTCNVDDQPLSDLNAGSGCTGGNAYMCSDQSPWAVSDNLAYGFAAVSIPGGDESSWCCGCYELTFTSTSIAGKKMIVQATNTGADLAEGQFDLAIPGGGVGIYNGCTDEWGAPPSGWGAQYGGISSNTCSTFPKALQAGCNWRFGDFFEGADNPTVDWKSVTCPKALTDKTGCVRQGETPTEGNAPTASSEAPAASSAPAAAASSSSAPAAASSEAAGSSIGVGSSSAAASASHSGGPVHSSSYASSAPYPSGSGSSAGPIGTGSTAPVGTAAPSSSSAPAYPPNPPPPVSSAAPGGGDECPVEYTTVTVTKTV